MLKEYEKNGPSTLTISSLSSMKTKELKSITKILGLESNKQKKSLIKAIADHGKTLANTDNVSKMESKSSESIPTSEVEMDDSTVHSEQKKDNQEDFIDEVITPSTESTRIEKQSNTIELTQGISM
jgi:hypothetical protein